MKETAAQVEFFLGTTTPSGFRGYFDTLTQENGQQLYLIKSGPGCGKSTLMRTLADQAESPVERIRCSSDPSSLDGVVFPDRGIAVVDATAPHSLEPRAPGITEQVISLYHTLDRERLQNDRAAMEQLLADYACLRSRTARYLASAGGLLLDSRRAAACSTDFEKVRSYAKRLAARLFPQTDTTGCQKLRFLSGITPQGLLCYTGTVQTLAAQKIIVFHDEYGAASRLLMELLRDEAIRRGHSVIVCPCAMHPEDKIDHLLIPGLGLALLTSNSWHPMRFAAQKNVHCRRFTDTVHLANFRSRLRFNHKAAAELLEQTVSLMAQAKQVHNQMEDIYRPAVDFAAVNRECERLLRELQL